MAQKVTETLLKRRVKEQRLALSTKLYEFRQDHELSQARLAEIAGVDRKTINRIENGHFSPAMDTIVRLCTALGVEPSNLLKQ